MPKIAMRSSHVTMVVAILILILTAYNAVDDFFEDDRDTSFQDRAHSYMDRLDRERENSGKCK